MDRYNLIDRFPTSLPKYQISLISKILRSKVNNPARVMYEKEDLMSSAPSEDVVEDLAFNHSDRLQLFLDAKNDYFQSRRINGKRLAEYLKKEYEHDPAVISEFADDKNPLFIILFSHTYNRSDNEVNMHKFTEARVASYSFKDRRDRMAFVEDSVEFESITKNIPDFINIMKSDIALTKVDWYINQDLSCINILFRQEQSRRMEPKLVERENTVVEYEERHPVRETALRISSEQEGTEINCYSSVNSWEETLTRFFASTVGNDYTKQLQERGSTKTKEIIEEVKETSDNDEEIGASNIETIVSNEVQPGEDIEQKGMTKEYVKRKVDEMEVTGVKVDSEENSLEIHSENGIESMMREYEGVASSLSEAVCNATPDEIEIYATVPNKQGEKEELTIENGEWYMKSGGDENTIRALESVLE